MDTAAYLRRIGYSGATTQNADTLRALHRAHMRSVPFENLDIARGTPLVVDPEANVRKIVELGRGGFCYELNGAFAALLQALGFNVTLLSARVAREAGGFGPEFDHLTLRVDLDEPWLADVGFGDSFVEPLRLKPDLEQSQDGRKFRIIEDPEGLVLQKQEPGEDWKNEYLFSIAPRRIEDFAEMCHYHQSSPQSSFTHKSVCTLATNDGRITVANGKLIITKNGQREERAISGEDEWKDLLCKHFGVVLS